MNQDMRADATDVTIETVLRKKNVLLDLVRLDCELVVSLFAIALTDCPHKAGEEPPVC